MLKMSREEGREQTWGSERLADILYPNLQKAGNRGCIVGVRLGIVFCRVLRDVFLMPEYKEVWMIQRAREASGIR
jgi:hypothetical protein